MAPMGGSTVRFPLRKPEDPQADRLYDIWKGLAEFIFRLATWSLTLIAVHVFAIKSKDSYLNGVYVVLQLAFFVYVMAVILYKIELDVIPLEKRNTWWKSSLDKLVNVLLAFALWGGYSVAMKKIVAAITSLQVLK
jgi:hypothetical protein